MPSYTHYFVKKLMDRAFGGQSYTEPTTWYLGLFTSAPGQSGGGTEVTGGSYARKAVTNNNTNFPDMISGSGQKFLGVEQAMATATASWGLITHFGWFDASTGGNLCVFGEVPTPVTINTSDIFRAPVGVNGMLLTLE